MAKKPQFPNPQFWKAKDNIDWKAQWENLKVCGGIVAQANAAPRVGARVCKAYYAAFRQVCGKLLIFGIGGSQLCRDAVFGLGFGRTVRCCRSRIAAACADAHEHRKN